MALRGERRHYRARGIQPRHFKALAAQIGDPGVCPQLISLAESVPEALASVRPTLPPDFPPNVWETIARRLTDQATRFLQYA